MALEEIDPKKLKLPCCLVWTPLPVVSLLAPFIGPVGICREDGLNHINVDDFPYGSVARYIQLDISQCRFPPNLTGHTCKHRYSHTVWEWYDLGRYPSNKVCLMLSSNFTTS